MSVLAIMYNYDYVPLFTLHSSHTTLHITWALLTLSQLISSHLICHLSFHESLPSPTSRTCMTETWKFDGKPGNLTGNLEIWREAEGNFKIWMETEGNLEIWRETWKFDGKPRNLMGNLEIWRETWKFDGKPGNLTGNLEIWKGTWKFDGEPTNLTGVARNSSYADDSWLPLAFSVAHLAASSNCLLSLVLDLLVWFLTSNFGP